MKYNIRKLAGTFFFPLLSASLLLAAGCSLKSSSGESEDTAGSSSSAGTSEAAATTEPLMAPMSEPTQYLDGFPENAWTDYFFNGPDDTLVVKIEDENSRGCSVYSPIENKEIRKVEFDAPDEDLVGALSDGTIVTKFYSPTVGIKFYKPGSETHTTVELGEVMTFDAQADMKNDAVYYADFKNAGIIRIDKDGNKTETIKTGAFTSVYGLDASAGLFKAKEESEDNASGERNGFFSLKNGERLADISGFGLDSAATSDRLADLVWGDDDSGSSCAEIDVFSRADGEYAATYTLPYDNVSGLSLYGSVYSDKLVLLRMADDSDYEFAGADLIDLKSGAIASVPIECDEGTMNCTARYCEGVERWFVAQDFYSDDYSSVTSKLLMIDPEQLDYDTELESRVEKRSDEPVQVGERFLKIRERADEIEKKFGVRILVGNEVKNAQSIFEYELESSEESDYPFIEENEFNRLEQLENVLAAYPEGFFKRFRTEDGKGGLRLSLVDALKNTDDSPFRAAGVAYVSGDWYDIAFNCDFIYDDALFHHEIWHAVENLVNKSEPLDRAAWSALNPPGFAYSYDFDAYSLSDEINADTYEYVNIRYGAGEIPYGAPYFISDYSRLTPMEDRATLIQELFSKTNDPVGGKETGRVGVEGVGRYPHLKAKLDFLAEWTRRYFGYVYWEELLRNTANTN